MLRSIPIRVRQPVIFALFVLTSVTVTQCARHPWIAIAITAAVVTVVVLAHRFVLSRARR